MFTARKRLRKDEIVNKDLSRLEDQVSPPLAIGHVTLVFTDICNLTHLWEVNPGMETAMLHFPTENDKQYPHCRASCAGFGPSSLPPPCSFQNTFLPSYLLAPALDPSYQCVFPKVPGQTWLDMYTWRLGYWVCQLWRTVMGTRLILYCISFIMNYKFKHTMSRVSGDCEKYDVIRRCVSLQGQDTSSLQVEACLLFL